jgi:hypothetical protein
VVTEFTKEKNMTKQQVKQVENIKLHLQIGNQESAAMGLSALVRAASNQKQSSELLMVADSLGLRDHPKFIV